LSYLQHDYAYFDVTIGDRPAGRLVIEASISTFQHHLPAYQTVEY